LLQAVGNAQRIEHPDRREQADQVAEEQDDDADMEQDRAPHQLLAAQKLAGRGFPGEGVAFIARDGADQRDCQHRIGHDAEDQEVDVKHGLGPPCSAALRLRRGPGLSGMSILARMSRLIPGSRRWDRGRR
jgi:hypothetical protein